MVTVKFLGHDCPYRMTVLGLETFCELSGAELSDYSNIMKNISTKSIKNLIWAGIVGGCAKEKKALPFTFEDFVAEANNYDFEDLITLIPKEKNDFAPKKGAQK